MAPVIYYKMCTHVDGLEAFLLPLFVPVAVGSVVHFIADAYALLFAKGKRIKHVAQSRLVKEVALYIASQALVILFKGLKTTFACHCCKHVAHILTQAVRSIEAKMHFKIFHYNVNFACKDKKNRENPTMF